MSWLRYVLGIGAWLFFAVLAMQSASEPGMEIVVVGFWLVTAVAAVYTLVRLARKSRPVAPARSGSHVAQCLPAPHSSPNVQQVASAIPDYCRALIFER